MMVMMLMAMCVLALTCFASMFFQAEQASLTFYSYCMSSLLPLAYLFFHSSFVLVYFLPSLHSSPPLALSYTYAHTRK